jgi:hypothetical protein
VCGCLERWGSEENGGFMLPLMRGKQQRAMSANTTNKLGGDSLAMSELNLKVQVPQIQGIMVVEALKTTNAHGFAKV